MTTLPVPQCKLCAQGILELSSERSQRQWSEIFDVARSSIQRHIKHVQEAIESGTVTESYVELGPKHRQDSDDDELDDEPSIAQRYGIPESAITTRTISEWGNGKSEKVTFRPNSQVVREALVSYEDIERVIDSIEKPDPDLETNPHTMVVLAADLQVGKTDLLGGTEELVQRVVTSFYKAALRARTEKPETIIIADLGDIIENFKNTASQRQTNDMTLTEQIRTARRILTEAIKILSPHTKNVAVVSVPSNHCQVRETFGQPSSTPHDDHGLDINYSLEEIFSGRDDMSHVSFLRPVDNYTESVVVDLGDAGGVVGFVHGHQSKSQEKMSDWFKGQVHGQRNGLDRVRTLFYGHFHNMKMEQTGNEKWLIGAPTSDAGSAWYTNQTGEQSTNGMLVLNLTENGRWANLEIL